MATGDRKINIFLNRLFDRTGIRDDFLEFLDKKIDETLKAIFTGRSGTLDTDTVGLAATVNDTFDLDMTNANHGIVGGGQVITLPLNANRVVSETKEIPFENTAATAYEVGVKFASKADGVAINPKTGAPEYKGFLETFGELGAPFSVVDDPGVKITLDIRTQTQAAIPHTGRKVIVFMTVPVSGVETVAFFTGTIAFVGGQNVVEITYSGGAGPLGQDTTVNPPSTTAADYQVFVPGASWKRGVGTIDGDNDYWFIGTVTGSGSPSIPSTFDVTTQLPVFLNSLDGAYDSSGGAGSGRTIQLDSKAMRLLVSGAGGSGDNIGSAHEIDARGNTKEWDGTDTVIGQRTGVKDRMQMLLKPFNGTAGNIPITDAATLGTGGTSDEITFVTGGVNLTLAELSTFDFAVLSGYSGSVNGIYRINVIQSATILEVVDLNGADPGFASETPGTVELFRGVYVGGVGHNAVGNATHVFAAMPAEGVGTQPLAVQIVGPDPLEVVSPQAAGEVVKRINDLEDAHIDFTDNGRIRLSYGGILIRPKTPAPTKDPSWIEQDATGLDPVKSLASMGVFKNWDGDKFIGYSTRGQVLRPETYIRESWNYREAAFGVASTQIPEWHQVLVSGSGANGVIVGNISAMGRGTIELQSGDFSTNVFRVHTEDIFRNEGTGGLQDRSMFFHARVGITVNDDGFARIGFLSASGGNFIGFRFNSAAGVFSANDIEVVQMTGSTVDQSTGALSTYTAATNPELEMVDLFMKVHANGTTVDFHIPGLGSSITTITLSTAMIDGNYQLILESENRGAGAGEEMDLLCSFIEGWDDVLMDFI